ncbi:MAG: hypothetical protein PHY64_09610 [Eubacteriales bacterium]|nr:hypothetical protein [Eubacteriales bacterium]
MGRTLRMRKFGKERYLVFGFLLVYFCLNLLFLTRYPLVHSDESWLSGLTQNMMAQGYTGVTEPFFDLKPRYPHAIKILFHLLQMPFLLVFGYSVFTVRLLSLFAGVAALYLFYRCCREVASFRLSFALTALVSLNGQFIAAAHTARQEILLLYLLLALALVLLQSRGTFTCRTAVKLGVLTGLGVGLHPNSLLLATGCGAAMLLLMLGQRRFSLKAILTYIGVTGGFALVFVGISLSFNPNFFADYLRYGEEEFELLVPVGNKFQQSFAYITRLWGSVSGTYLLPDLKPQLVLCALLALFGAVQAVRTRSFAVLTSLGLTVGALAGTILIGRYNQLSAILWMFPCLLLLAPLLAGRKFGRVAVPLIAAVFSVTACIPVVQAYAYSYNTYLSQIAAYVTPDTKTLVNLNAGFYFNNGAFLDVRNLTYLKENNLSFADYVKSRNIQAIVWSDEMEFIYNRRPSFNVLYGNPRYVPEVETFLQEHCTLLGTFDSPGYGMRIVQEIGQPCAVRVYRVNPY